MTWSTRRRHLLLGLRRYARHVVALPIGVVVLLTGAAAGILAVHGDVVSWPLLVSAIGLVCLGAALGAAGVTRLIGPYGSAPTKDVNPEAPPDHRG